MTYNILSQDIMDIINYYENCDVQEEVNKLLKLDIKYKYHLSDLKLEEDEPNKFFYIAKQYFNSKNEPIYKYSKIEINKQVEFIHKFLYNDNNLFELIPDYKKVCLFFDLERKVETFDNQEAEVLLNNFLIFLKNEINKVFQISINTNDIIILNSCSNNKISYHVIIKKIVFENMQTLKIFIDYINNNNNIDNFIDFSVYKKNQLIRFINQSKIDKKVQLINNNIDIDKTFISVNNKDYKFVSNNDESINKIKDQTKKQEQKQQIKREYKTQNKKINFNQELINLRTIKNINIDDFNQLSEAKQYLYLINQPRTWDDYFKIACALSRENEPVETFKEWAKLFINYDENDKVIKDYKTYKDKREEGYNIFTLRKLAKEDNPDFLKTFYNFNELNNNLIDLDLTNYNIIKEETKYINNFHIFNIDKYVIIYSPMGKGKTTFIMDYLKIHFKKSMLFISTRQTFADYVSNNDFKDIGFKNYLEVENKKDLKKYDKLVISLESIHYIEEVEKFDIILLDESETILKQLDSETIKGKLYNNYKTLKRFIKNSEKVFIADAFITNRSINFINNFKGDKTIIINDKPNIKRTAYKLSEDKLIKKLIESIKKKEKNYICFGSNSKQKKIINYLIENDILKKEENLSYSSCGDDSNNELLKNINVEWKKYKIVSTSPTITVGCSFTELYFNNCFIFGFPSCTVRDIMQTHMRARNLINNNLYYCTPKEKDINFIMYPSKTY